MAKGVLKLLQIGLGLCAVALTGCTAMPPEASVLYRVTVSRTPFYSVGPAQTQGPDFLLAKDDPVTMLQREYGFSKVRTANGQDGYVATDRLAPIPVPAWDSAPTRKSPRKNRTVEPLRIVPLDQMLEPVEPPLPSGGGGAP